MCVVGCWVAKKDVKKIFFMYYVFKSMTNEAVKVIPSKQSRILDRLVIKALRVAQKVSSMESSA